MRMFLKRPVGFFLFLVLFLALPVGAPVSASDDAGWSPGAAQLLRDPGSADPKLDREARAAIYDELHQGFRQLMAGAFDAVAAEARSMLPVTFETDGWDSSDRFAKAIGTSYGGHAYWEFEGQIASHEGRTDGTLTPKRLFRMSASAYVDPAREVWAEEAALFAPHDQRKAVRVNDADAAVLRYYNFNPGGHWAKVTWRRDTHVVTIELLAPTPDERESFSVALAERVDSALRASGFFDFPLKAGGAGQPQPAAPAARGGARVLSVELLDANPLYSPDGRTLPGDLKPTQLIAAKVARKGSTADGVSQLILRAELSEAVPVGFDLTPVADDPSAPLGRLAPLLGGRSVTLEGRHYAFALYTPPERFDPPATAETAPQSPLTPPGARLESGLEMREIHLWAKPEGGGESGLATMILARPPVVLVHGLFSDPVQTWVKTGDDGASMAALLERAGFLPFLVNYQDTNGSAPVAGEKRASFLLDAKDTPYSTFKDNARVVWDSPRVDYTPIRYEYGWLEEEPILSELQKPQATRIGGISQALSFYRDELGLAATQAVVVGHSMGGLLARVWASPGYNADYLRPENFHEGDIDRLLTLNTPHHGSELMELKDAFLNADVAGEGWLDWARHQLANTALWYYLTPESGAIRDLRPESAALKLIGETKLPVYAIATRFGEGELGAARNDPLGLYRAVYALAGTVFFNNRPLLDAFVDKRFADWDGAGDQRRTADWRGQGGFDLDRPGNLTRYKQVIGQGIDDNVFFWAARREADFQDELRSSLRAAVIADYGVAESSMGNDNELEVMTPHYLFGNALVGADVSRAFDDSRESDVPETFLTILRNLVFHNDPMTDGAVRVQSQIGGAQASETIENVLHSYAPWDYRVQRRVLFLLRGESARFDAGGFPAAGAPLPRYLPSQEMSDARRFGAEAVAWSGLVPSHAREFLRVADAEDVVIMVRPVNAASTGLLARNAAAKGMNVKGKSANWGPQVGLIPYDQRYSKLWRTVKDPDRRRLEIEKYNKDTKKSTTEWHPELSGRHYAVTRALAGVQTRAGACDVLTDPEAANAEDGVVLKCSDGFFRWQNAVKNGKDIFDPDQPLVAAQIETEAQARFRANPMLVLADDTSELDPRPYLTADYDLLAIGFPFEADQCGGAAPVPGAARGCLPAPTKGVAEAGYDKLRGYISPRQMGLLDKLNGAVRDRTGYCGGLVSHHGPEVQYDKSPYVDYPILVFDPMRGDAIGDGQVYLVRQGPPGFRDIHLKRLFAEKNRQGYNLWPNPASPAWRWTERRAFDMARGYDPRDVANLPPYVDEAPPPDAGAVARARQAWSATPPVETCGGPDAGAVLALPQPGSDTAVAADEGRAPPDAPVLPEQAVLPDPDQSVPDSLGFFDRRTFRQAQKGKTRAQLQLADWYEHGLHLPADPAAALGWYAAAAGKGDPQAQFRIAEIFAFGQMGVPRNPEAGARWMALAAEGGHAMAQYTLAETLAGQAGRDPQQALTWYVLAAEQGLAPAQVALGFAYSEGRMTQTDYALARDWFQKAAAQGATRAQIALGNLAKNGQGGPIDYRAAEAWYRKAADQDDPEAFFRLGALYESIEWQTHAGPETSIGYQMRAAGMGHSEAAFRLGQRYGLGLGVEPNDAKAVSYLTLAVEQGHAGAMAALAGHHELGSGVEKSYDLAAGLYRRSADLGNAGGQSGLASLYIYGLGVEKDLGKAVELYSLAAEQNHRFAQNHLGQLYAAGTGVARDPAQAQLFFTLAAEQGHTAAAEARDALEAQLTAEERTEAAQLLRDWKAAHEREAAN
ncbi:MAG: anthrax toxin-like adenylyl cyclase domain-containing protein [Paracoccaceae bacterium]